MPYTTENFKTKKLFKTAVDSGLEVGVYQPGPFGPKVSDGITTIEGPHYPQPHKWYATCKVLRGLVQKGSVK